MCLESFVLPCREELNSSRLLFVPPLWEELYTFFLLFVLPHMEEVCIFWNRLSVTLAEHLDYIRRNTSCSRNVLGSNGGLLEVVLWPEKDPAQCGAILLSRTRD